MRGARHRVPRERRGPGHLRALAGEDHRLQRAGRPRRARRLGRVRELHGAAALRLAARQADRPRRGPRDGHPRMQRALGEYVVQGIRTNIPFHRAALAEEAFVRGRLRHPLRRAAARLGDGQPAGSRRPSKRRPSQRRSACVTRKPLIRLGEAWSFLDPRRTIPLASDTPSLSLRSRNPRIRGVRLRKPLARWTRTRSSKRPRSSSRRAPTTRPSRSTRRSWMRTRRTFASSRRWGSCTRRRTTTRRRPHYFTKVAESYAHRRLLPQGGRALQAGPQARPDLLDVNLKLAELHQQLQLMSEAMAHYQVVANHYDKAGDTKAVARHAEEDGRPRPRERRVADQARRAVRAREHEQRGARGVPARRRAPQAQQPHRRLPARRRAHLRARAGQPRARPGAGRASTCSAAIRSARSPSSRSASRPTRATSRR